MDEGGSVDAASVSEEAPWRGPWGEEAPSLGTLEDMLRKSPDTGHLSPWGTISIRGKLGMWGGGLLYRG